MYLEQFIYYQLYNKAEITQDLIPVEQPWCKNLIVADLLNDKMEFRKREEVTLAMRRIKDYENKTLLKKIHTKFIF